MRTHSKGVYLYNWKVVGKISKPYLLCQRQLCNLHLSPSLPPSLPPSSHFARHERRLSPTTHSPHLIMTAPPAQVFAPTLFAGSVAIITGGSRRTKQRGGTFISRAVNRWWQRHRLGHIESARVIRRSCRPYRPSRERCGGGGCCNQMQRRTGIEHVSTQLFTQLINVTL